MRNLLIDLSAIKTGGGAQRALNFVNVLANMNVEYNIFILRPQGYFTEVSNFSKVLAIINTPPNYLIRTIYENFMLKRKIKELKIDIVLTFAGTGIPLPKNVPSLVGVAYPIICYDDSPYWKHLRKTSFLKQKIKNYYRKRRLKKATMIFAQTTVMKNRLSLYLQKNVNEIKICPPSPSMFVKKSSKSAKNIILLLSGNDPHKNLWRLYEVAQILCYKNIKCQFSLTVDRLEWLHSLKSKTIDIDLVDDYFIFHGKVKSDKIQRLYDEATILLQLSDLESFSNNYMESWKAHVPLIVSDRDFSREICKDSALYVEPHAPNDVADKIIRLIGDKNLQETFILNGEKLLSSLPSQKQYFENIISLLNGIEEKN